MLRRNVLKQIETKATGFYNIYKKNFYFFLPLRTNKAKHQKNMSIKILQIILTLILLSCNRNDALSKLYLIKQISDNNPALATKMLDSIYVDIEAESKYTRMKYKLLKLRTNEKNGVKQVSNINIENLIKYFAQKGSPLDKQEAYFYAGCVYRDLNDTPRALEYFNNSIDIMYDNKEECDSALYRDAYSNLFYIFKNIHDQQTVLSIAKKEYKLSNEINDISINTIMHIGEAYLNVGNVKNAMYYFDTALNSISQDRHAKKNRDIYLLLACYSDMGQLAKARKCLELIRNLKITKYGANEYYAFAKYYQLTNIPDSAIAYYKRVLQSTKTGYELYDASKALLNIYTQKGDLTQVARYSNEFIKLTDSLNFKANRQLAATEYNEFQYHLDRNRLQKSEYRQFVYRLILITAFIIIVLIILIFIELYIRKKQNYIKKQTSLSNDLHQKETELYAIKKVITEKENMLTEAKKNIENQKKALEEITNELQNNERQLDDMRARLSDKHRQNQSLVQMLQKTKMEESASDMITDFKNATIGKKQLTNEDWRKMFAAVNELYPDFKDQLLQHNGKLNELQMKVCYLMCIGLNGPQINNIVDMSRSTIWRWLKNNEWIYMGNERKCGEV